MTDTTNTQEPGPMEAYLEYRHMDLSLNGKAEIIAKAREVDQQLAAAITRADELERDRDRWKERVVSERDAHALRYAAWNEERNTLTRRGDRLAEALRHLITATKDDMPSWLAYEGDGDGPYCRFCNSYGGNPYIAEEVAAWRHADGCVFVAAVLTGELDAERTSAKSAQVAAAALAGDPAQDARIAT